jgi:hypothetical protein
MGRSLTTDMAKANQYLESVYRPAFNAEFSQPPLEQGSAFIPWFGGCVEDILCEQYDRVVNSDHCVQFDGLAL